HAQDQGPGDGGPGWHHHHRGGAMMHELKELNLSDSQKASIKTLFKTSHEQFKPQFEALRTQHQAFAAATPGSPEFQSATSSLAQAASSAASARVQQEAELRTQVYALLTDAQKQQLATLQAQHQAKMAEWQARHAQSAD
ncbi:MAG TPA: Spy/CpxP family protein refolding chaperone, partial [Nevskia sp.]|nr:Spy/CpxP family protein refolding chaperone [Nevskia sp.]